MKPQPRSRSGSLPWSTGPSDGPTGRPILRRVALVHFVHNLAITFDGADRARGRSSFEAVGDMGGVAFVAAGYYENEYVRTGDGWRFSLHRELPLFFVKTGESWAGPKPRIMSEWTRRP